jgi:hypothetical protein
MATTTYIITEDDAWAHPALGFIEPEVVPETGFWRIFKPPGSSALPGPRTFGAQERAAVVAALQGVCDVYVSQNIFAKRRCRANHVQWIPGAWVDLDIYRIPGLSEQPRPVLIRQLLEHCDARGVPRPSYTISSGRGLYLKWTFTTPAGAGDAAICTAINDSLADQFATFGADTRATDTARILRPVGSVNSKSGAVVHVAHREDTDAGTPLRHDRAALQTAVRAVVPQDRANAKPSPKTARPARSSTPAPRFTLVPPTGADPNADTTGGRGWRGWNGRVFADITRLADLRWPNGPIQEGWRDLFAFHAAVQIAHLKGASQVLPALRAWAAPRLPPAFVADELEAYMQSVCERAWRAQNGETVAYQRRSDGPVEEVSPLYTYKRATLIDRLGITPAESRNLDVLIHADERRRRERKRKAEERRARGCRTHGERAAEREVEADEVALRIDTLRAQGRCWSEIAAALGISAGAARQRLRRLKKRRADRETAAAAGEAA